MINAILATNFDDLNNHIKEQFNVIEVIVDDIQTQLEALTHIQQTKNIDAIILSDMLRGSIGICDFVERVVRVKEEKTRIYYLAQEYTPALKKILCSNNIRFFTPGTQTIEEFIQVIVKESEGTAPQLEVEKPEEGKKKIFSEIKKILPEIKNNSEKKSDIQNEIKNENKSTEQEMTKTMIGDPRFEPSRVICIMAAPGVHPGNSVIASNLAYYCSASGKKTALVDISPGAGQFYNYDIFLKNIKRKYDLPGYNCLDTLINAMSEDDTRLIPDLSYTANPKLNIFTRDIECLKDNEFSGIFNFLDRLRTIYQVSIVDTSGYGDGVREAVAIANTVFFVTDMTLSSVTKSLRFLEKIKGIVNTSKFALVLNHYEESKEITLDDILKSHEERGIVFKEVLTIPYCNKACIESQYLRKHATELSTATEEFKKSFESLYSSIFYSAPVEKKFKGLGRFFK